MKRSNENPYQTQRAHDFMGTVQLQEKANRIHDTRIDTMRKTSHPDNTCNKTAIRSVVEEVHPEDEGREKEMDSGEQDPLRKGQLLTKWDTLATWILRKLLPKSLRSAPPPDRQVYY